ncbi:MAG: PASTA domain-containing protein [Ruminococcus sp.]|nr:PASTA domain-containing protein [Ruminococcus sp.]
MGLIFLLAAALVCNIFKISVIDNEKYQELANSNQFNSITISANRGSIYSSDGSILAQSATVFKVFIDPQSFNENDSDKKDITVDFLAETLDLDEKTILDKMSNLDSQYQVLKTKVEKPVVDEINEFLTENEISSISTEEDTKRYYPQNDLAASVIGFTNYDGEGWYGIEAYYDDELSGVDGKVISAQDGRQNEMPYRNEKLYEAQDGNSLVLTIDTTLQYYLEKNLEEMYNKYELDNRACGIIMNVNTGAILAMATCPSFDLNNPSEITDERTLEKLDLITDEEERTQAEANARELQWKNKAITETYIPGSVFKVITSSAAFEEDLIDLDNDTFYCTGVVDVSGTSIKCHKLEGHGMQSFKDALTNSCNPAFIEIGKRLGAEKFFYYFEAFGLTEKTGIDLPSEVSSIYASESSLGAVELASSSFGQTNKLTPIEMITAYAATINGGNLLTPYVVQKVLDADGNVISNTEPTIKRQVISEETSAIMRESLEYVVDNNGGSNAYIKGYKIGGKSGTSQKLDEYGEDDMRYVASYVCFAPADDPEIIMLIMADEPTTGEYYGSVVAVPCARSILEEVLPYLGYYPEYTDDELETLDTTVPSVEGTTLYNAESTLEELGLEYQVVGNGDMVVTQVPTSGNSIAKGGKVVLYTEANSEQEFVEVPNLVGSSLTQANQLLSSLGLNYVVTGASAEREDATVYSQSYAEGERVPVGTIIELNFVVKDQSG